MQKSNSDILLSEDPSAIGDLIVRAFTPTRTNRTPKLGINQLKRAALLVSSLGNIYQMLNAWSAVPRRGNYLPVRELLLKAALRDTQSLYGSPWVLQKLSQTTMTSSEVELLFAAFGENEEDAQRFMVAVAKSRPPMPPAPLYYIPDVPATLAPR